MIILAKTIQNFGLGRSLLRGTVDMESENISFRGEKYEPRIYASDEMRRLSVLSMPSAHRQDIMRSMAGEP